MKIFKNLGKLLLGNNIHLIIKKYNQSFLVNLFSIVTIGLVLIYGIDEYLTQKNTIILAFDIAAIFLLLVNLIILFQNKNRVNFAGNLFMVVITIYLLGVFSLGKIEEPDILWYATFPVFSLLLFPKRGNIYATLFFVVILAGLFIPFSSSYTDEFRLTYKILFIVAYIGSFFLVELLKQSITNIFQNQQNELSRIQEELKDKEDFISKVSHQIRTPLNNIVVVSNMIDPSKLEEKHKDYFDTILASTNNIVDVVNSFSEITNVDVQERKKYEIKFDLYNTLQNTVNLFSEREEAQTRYPIQINSDINYQLIGDPVKIKQIFLNLIEQILKNSDKEKRKIQIHLKEKEKQNETIRISFALETEGLLQPEKTTKSKSAAKKDQSAQNLEVNIARRTIHSLGGELETYSTNGKVTFKFELDFKQLKESDKAPSQYTTEIDKADKDISVDLKDANVLLVEDNLINQKIVLLSLKKAVKNVDVANNGKEALDKFGSVKYDIILMDIQMPVMNGIITTKKIRNIEKSTNTHTPIIAITANALLGDKEECLAAGTDDYISKPFQIETLLDKMESLLSK